MSACRENATGRIAALGLLALMLLSCASVARAQSSDMNALAADAAAAITRNTKDLRRKARVLIYDFSGTDRPNSRLGIELADELETALKKEANAFTVLDRNGTLVKMAYAGDDEKGCRERARGEDITVKGVFEILPGDIASLWIRVIDGEKTIFDERISLTISVEMARSAQEEEPLPNDFRGKIMWTRPDFGQNGTETPVHVFKKGEQGYKLPSCVYCPTPHFSDEALNSKVQGTALLDVQIDADGLPMAIKLVKPLACGLTEQAVDAVAHWRFKPATGPDDKPVAVIATVEVSFRMY